jgi:hypothetical protein
MAVAASINRLPSGRVRFWWKLPSCLHDLFSSGWKVRDIENLAYTLKSWLSGRANLKPSKETNYHHMRVPASSAC